MSWLLGNANNDGLLLLVSSVLWLFPTPVSHTGCKLVASSDCSLLELKLNFPLPLGLQDSPGALEGLVLMS
jgi:hypothetical protein